MELREYTLGNTVVAYLLNDRKNTSMFLYPAGKKDALAEPWELEVPPLDARADYNRTWRKGSLAYFMVKGENMENAGFTMKASSMSAKIKMEDQFVEESAEKTTIVTVLNSEEGYKIKHYVTYYTGKKGLEVETEFINETQGDVELEMLSSVALDNISPFHEDDAPNAYYLHRFYGGWSLEGKHNCQSIEELGLEKSWAGFNLSSERFGSIGSWPVERYFPTAVFEDRDNKTFWAMQLCHNATWQMELGRLGDTMSFTGGLGDKDFCGWSKVIAKGESFKGPKAFVACVEGDIFDACGAVTDMQKVAWEKYGEEGLPIQFNEYCTTWGKPTQKKMLSYCNALKDFDIKYLVVDAGWCKEGHEQSSNGEWNVDKNIFPDIKAMNAEIRKAGKVPGIWFEMEVTTSGSPLFEEEYDYMHLKRAGKVVKIKNFRSYWDFRREDVRDYLREKVINFLKENDFGYIKIDYNSNIGRGVDGGDSDAEALREHLAAVREFFVEMKREIPDLIIENCAAGGHRLEPSMMGVTALSSFSDAHEAIEIPYVAANLQNLMLPAQSLIWAVLHNDETVERTIYSLAATFMGRVCISGQIDELREEQYEIIRKAIDYYKKLEDIIKNGSTKIYGNRSKSTRYPTGTQAVVRKTDKEMLVVCHAFEQPAEEIVIDIPEGYMIKDSFYADKIRVENSKLIIGKMDARTAQSVLLSAE